MTQLHPTTHELKLWRALVRQARTAAMNPTGAGGDLRKAASRASRAQAPSTEALTAVCSPLIRLSLAWPAMNDATRKANADRMKVLADGVGALVGEAPDPRDRPGRRKLTAEGRLREPLRFMPPDDVLADMPRPERQPRRDIHG